MFSIQTLTALEETISQRLFNCNLGFAVVSSLQLIFGLVRIGKKTFLLGMDDQRAYVSKLLSYGLHEKLCI